MKLLTSPGICHRFFCWLAIGLAVGFTAISAPGIEPVYSFQLGPRNPEAGLATDGTNLFGTTFGGGSSSLGTVFEYEVAEGVVTNVVSIGYTNGAYPVAGLWPAGSGNGTYYGTTLLGGSNDLGCIFKLTSNNTLMQLASLNLTNGAYPYGGLVADTKGNLYGTAYNGGSAASGRFYGWGTVFKLTTNNVLTNIASFTYFNGGWPQGSLLYWNTNLYGTTSSGGASSNGVVFRVSTTGVLSNLVSFNFGNGASPCGGLVETNNLLFGTTSGGGASSNGTVFVTTAGGNLITLFSFSGFNGSNPQAGLTRGSDGNLYGTTFGGGLFSYGTIFKITQQGLLTTLHSFNYIDGANPQGVLVQLSNGDFYGTTAAGGLYGAGTIFKITAQGYFTTLHSINPGGGSPSSGLLLGVNGTNTVLYGTAAFGIQSNNGEIFGMQLGTSNQLNLQVPFSSLNGANPDNLLVQGADGNFYGTTFGDGISDNGTVFRLNTNGVITTLFTFPATNSVANGAHPLGGLVEDTNSLILYGTTSQGGPANVGTFFKINLNYYTNTAPGFTNLAYFSAYVGNGGAFPEGTLLPGAKDFSFFYGTTAEGGTSGDGTVFMVASNGVVTTIASFNGANGSDPQSGVIFGTNGDLYGVTASGGAYGYGTLFQLDPKTSSINAIFSFMNDTNGFDPQGPLAVDDSTGYLYGTAQQGGLNNCGTVFCLNPSTTNISIMGTFDMTNSGAFPNGGLVWYNSNLYGTTSEGGAGGAGTAFGIWTSMSSSMVGNELVVSWPVRAIGYNLQSTTKLTSPNWTAYPGKPTIAGSYFTVTNPMTPGARFFRLSNPRP